MPKRYKVWIQVEEIDDQAGTYQNIAEGDWVFESFSKERAIEVRDALAEMLRALRPAPVFDSPPFSHVELLAQVGNAMRALGQDMAELMAELTVMDAGKEEAVECPHCHEMVTGADASAVADHGMCGECHHKWQHGELDWQKAGAAVALVDGVPVRAGDRCPTPDCTGTLVLSEGHSFEDGEPRLVCDAENCPFMTVLEEATDGES